MTDWQPIDTAPRDGTAILTWNGRVVQESIWQSVPDDDGKIGWCGSCFSYGGVLYELHNLMEGEGAPTHWMPLPAPPEDTP